jgi:hypothetical protein
VCVCNVNSFYSSHIQFYQHFVTLLPSGHKIRPTRSTSSPCRILQRYISQHLTAYSRPAQECPAPSPNLHMCVRLSASIGYSSILGCNDTPIRNLLAFRRKFLLPSSSSKLSKAYLAPERGGSKLLQNLLHYSFVFSKHPSSWRLCQPPISPSVERWKRLFLKTGKRHDQLEE